MKKSNYYSIHLNKAPKLSRLERFRRKLMNVSFASKKASEKIRLINLDKMVPRNTSGGGNYVPSIDIAVLNQRIKEVVNLTSVTCEQINQAFSVKKQ
jgi:hypothetical protein